METSRLSSWMKHGPTQMAINAHTSIRDALQNLDMPTEVNVEIFLQGSYKNHTNIRGDGDVDIVVSVPDTFYHNLNREDALLANIYPPSISWEELDTSVRNALINRYGSSNVVMKNKAINVKFDNNSYAPADVIITLGYRHYTTIHSYSEGISFIHRGTRQLVYNFPKQHYDNGNLKSNTTDGIYRSYVRLLKRARNHILENLIPPTFDAPSYFIESLVYNLDDSYFLQSPENFIKSAINLWEYNDQSNDMCQNRITPMYGYADTCWNHHSKIQFSAAIRNMMNY